MSPPYPLLPPLPYRPMTRIAIVTGAARGIGAGITRRLAADGCSVAVLDRDEAACAQTVGDIEAAGGRAIGVGADVASEGAVASAAARVRTELGAPTVKRSGHSSGR